MTRVIAIEPLGVDFIASLPDLLRVRARTVVGEETTGTWRTFVSSWRCWWTGG